MGEGDSTATVRNLEPSISFGRFENDLLSWDKWSVFSQNKYLEEVEKCAMPGSVKQKKAYFEARNILIAARKADVKQMDAFTEMEVQNTGRGEVRHRDEEPVDKYVFDNELGRPDMGDHPELEKDVIESHEPGVENIDRCINDEVAKGAILSSETSYPLSIDDPKKDITLFESKSEMYNDSPDENTYAATLETEEQEKQVLQTKHIGCGTDQPSNMKTCIVGAAQASVENRVGCSSVMDSNFDTYIDAPESGKLETISKIEFCPSKLDQLNLDNALPSKSPSTGEGVNVKLKDLVDSPALETVEIVLYPETDRILPNNPKDKIAGAQNLKVNPLKTSEKQIISVKKQNSIEYAKKSTSNPRSSQISASKITKPSTPTVKSAPRPLPLPRVASTAASTARKSREFLNTSGSTPHSTTPSMKPAFFSPSKKGVDSLSSKIKSISAGATRKPTTTALHMSLNFGSKISGSVPSSTLVNEPRKSVFMEQMGDKEIVKRVFKAFNNMSVSKNSVGGDTNATEKQVVKNIKPSTPILQKEKERLAKKDVTEKSRSPTSNPKTRKPTFQSKEDKRKEVRKVTEKIDLKEAAKSSFQSKHKEDMKVKKESLTYKATIQPHMYKGRGLSKSYQNKDDFRSEQWK